MSSTFVMRRDTLSHMKTGKARAAGRAGDSGDGRLVQLAFRVPRDLVRRAEAYRRQLALRYGKGVKVTRSDAVRVLLGRGLEAEGLGDVPPPAGASGGR